MRLKCPAVGQPTPTVVWSLNGSQQPIVRAGVPVKIRQRSFALVLEDVQSSDTGRYTCRVCNTHGCLEHTQRLVVSGKNTTRASNKNNSYINQIQLLTDHPDNVQLEHVEPEIMSQKGVDSSSDANADADVAGDDDVADYYSDDDINTGTEQSQHSILDTAAAQITDKHSLITLHVRNVGTMIRLRCPVSGRPEPTVDWTRDDEDEPIVRKSSTQHHHGDLKLSNLRARDAGNYTCTACNEIACDRLTVELRVLTADGHELADDPHADPDTDVDVVDVSAALPATTPLAPGPPQFVRFDTFNRLLAKPSGNMVRMKCPAVGTPTPTIKWTKANGQPIKRHMGDFKNQKFAIVLEDLIPADSGNYTCTVCNVHGCISYTMKLEVNGEFFVGAYWKMWVGGEGGWK